jgi:hypothetical protein
MTTATTTAYRAQTDAGTKRWHLGTAEKANVCLCGARLMVPGDTRAFALKVPAEARDYQTSEDLSLVTCGACRKNREYVKATTTAEATAQATAHAQSHPAATSTRRARAQRATVSEPEAAAMAETAAAATPQGPKPRRRQSRADKAHAAQERDAARLATAQAADAALEAIDAALSDVAPE